MFCSRCGHPLNGNIVCPTCGYNNINHEQLQNTNHYVLKQTYDKTFKSQIIIGISISCSIIIITFVYLMLTSNTNGVYFSNENNVNEDDWEQVDVNQEKNETNKVGVTSIVYDTRYQINVPTTKDSVLDMVRDDSVKQKEQCSSKIIEIENRIINNYQLRQLTCVKLMLIWHLN